LLHGFPILAISGVFFLEKLHRKSPPLDNFPPLLASPDLQSAHGAYDASVLPAQDTSEENVFTKQKIEAALMGAPSGGLTSVFISCGRQSGSLYS